jgi:glutamate-1-semialdehyde 2,1-aminomutase
MLMVSTLTEAQGSVGELSRAAFEPKRRVFAAGTIRVTIERDSVPRHIAKGQAAYRIDVDGSRFPDRNGNFTNSTSCLS